MNMSIEELVNRIVADVLAELSKRGVTAVSGPPQRSSVPAASESNSAHSAVYVVDVSGFRSAVLLENHLLPLGPEVKEIAVPCGTVMTPGAKEIMKKKNLKLKSIPKTN